MTKRPVRRPPARTGQLPPLPPGSLVDHFQVTRCLGRGGMGVVYLARDMKLGRRIALKLIDPALTRTPEAISLFLREARATARFNHPHIVTIHAVGQHEAAPYIALEYLEGQTLRERLDEGLLGVKESVRGALAIAEALREAHGHGLVHGDLKPANVLIPADGRLRVVDFGICRVMDPHLAGEAAGGPGLEPSCPEAGAGHDPRGTTIVWIEPFEGRGKKPLPAVGTPAYMAPEQWRAGQVTGAADVWSLGLMLGEVLAGWHPYEELLDASGRGLAALNATVTSPEPVEVPEDLGRGVPEGVAQVIRACLCKDAGARPTAAELVDRLDDLLAPGLEAGQLAGECPFPGLQPFTATQARFFFGREGEIAACVERLRTEAVLPVIGPAGVGKSSFVRAGLIPRLQEQGRRLVLELTPGSDPLDALAGRILAADEGPDASSHQRHALRMQLLTTPHLLSLELRSLARRTGCRVVLFVDQLEEVITQVLDPSVRRAFIEAICSSADDRADPVRVVFTLRDDYLGRVAQSPRAREVLGRVFVLTGPDAEALEQIVTRPPEVVGYDYDDALLPQDLVTAVLGEPAALPLLQFTARMLWERRERRSRALQRAAYDAFGGVAGALADHADAVLEALSPGQRWTTRALLLRLVAPDGTRRVLPRDELLEGLGDKAAEVLAQLIEARLLTVKQEDDRGVARIGLIHGCLINCWDRLSRWITEGQDELRFLSDLNRAAGLWSSRGEREDELWGPEALGDAERALTRSTIPLSPQPRSFLAAGLKRERRRKRRRRGVALLLVAVVLAAAVGAAAAIRAVVLRGEQAQQERDRALASWAEAQREGARAALARGDVLEARAKLRESLESWDSPAARVIWRRLRQHPLIWSRPAGSIIYDVAFAADGSTVAAAAQDHTVLLTDVRTGRVRPLRGHGDQVFGVATGGGRLASATLSGEVRLWNMKSGRPLFSTKEANAPMRALALSPDGRTVVVGTSFGRVRVWRPDRSGEAAAALLGPRGAPVECLVFAPDGKRVALGRADGRVLLLRLDGGVKALRARGPAVHGVAFSPDGASVATADARGVVRRYNTETGARELERSGSGRAARAVRFSPDGRVLAVATLGVGVRLLRADSGQLLRVLPGTKQSLGLAFAPGSQLLATGGLDALRLWDTSHRGARRRGDSGPLLALNTVAFSPDGKLLATGSVDHAVRLWRVADGELVRVIRGHRDLVYRVAFSPKGRLLASASWDGTVRVSDAANGAQRRILDLQGAPALDLAFNANGRLLAAGDRRGRVRIWRVRSGRQIRSFGRHRGAVIGVAFGPGSRLATTSYDGKLRIFAVDTGRLIAAADHRGRPYGVAFSPDGRRLATTGWDGRVRLWDAARLSHRVIGRHRGRAYRVAFGRGGRLATVGADSRAQLWRMTPGGGARTTLLGHRGEVNDLAFSRDGGLMATAADDGTLRLWRTESGRPVWRTSALVGAAPLLRTHRGWSQLDGGRRDLVLGSCGRRCRAAMARARWVTSTSEARLLCLTFDSSAGDRLELWDARRDLLLSSERVEGLQRAVALPNGCATLSRSGVARLHRPRQRPRLLARGVRALTWNGRTLLLAEEGRVRFVGPDGRRTRPPVRTPAGISAVVLSGERLLLGFEDGGVRLSGLTPGRRAVVLQETPSSAVTSLRALTSTLVAVGFANGVVGLWGTRDGALLEQAWLHGPVEHLVHRRAKLHAVSGLGQHLTWDLAVMRWPYCRLLREVWSRVPVVWERGAAHARVPPSSHACAVGVPQRLVSWSAPRAPLTAALP